MYNHDWQKTTSLGCEADFVPQMLQQDSLSSQPTINMFDIYWLMYLYMCYLLSVIFIRHQSGTPWYPHLKPSNGPSKLGG